MSHENDLNSLKSLWQEQSFPLPDIQKKVKRQSRSMLMSGIVSAVVVGAVVIAFFYFLMAGTNIWKTILAGAMALWGIVFWILSMRYYKGMWQHNGESTQVLLDIQVRRCEADIRISKMAIFFCFLAIGLYGLWFFSMAVADWQNIVNQPGKYVFSWVFVIAYVGAYIVWCQFIKKKKQKELNNLKAIAADFKGEAP